MDGVEWKNSNKENNQMFCTGQVNAQASDTDRRKTGSRLTFTAKKTSITDQTAILL